jgi:hypothetical protein
VVTVLVIWLGISFVVGARFREASGRLGPARSECIIPGSRDRFSL